MGNLEKFNKEYAEEIAKYKRLFQELPFDEWLNEVLGEKIPVAVRIYIIALHV